MLSRLLIVRLRAAETALREGRLDEAFRVAAAPDIQAHRRGPAFMVELAEKFLARGRSHFDAERFAEALRDLERAEAGGGPRERIAELREQIRTVADEVARQTRTQKERIDQARQRMEQGSLAAGRLILEAAPKNDPHAAEMKRRIEARDQEASEAFARVERLMKDGQLIAAAERLSKAKMLDPHDPQCPTLEAELCTRILANVRESIQDGQVGRAADELACLRDLGKASPVRREIEELIRLVQRAGQALRAADYDDARQQLMRVLHLAPKVGWVSQAVEQLRTIDEGITALRAGPLGAFEGRPASGGVYPRRPSDALPERHHMNANTNPAARFAETIAMPMPQVGADLPDRILLLVDGGGSYLLLRGSRVTIGRAATSDPADVPIFSDLAERHAELARIEDDYFLFSPHEVELEGRRTTHQLLKDRDRVVLGPKAKFTFKLPNRKSPTAIMDLSDTSRMPNDVRRVILFNHTAMIGHGRSVHIPCPMAQVPLVLFERAGSLWLRPEGRGAAATEAVPVVMGHSVEAAGVRLVAKAWPSKS